MSLADILNIMWVTFLPFLELRASIPFGIISGVHWSLVFVIAVVTNILLGIFLYHILDRVIYYFTKIDFIDKLYGRYVEKTQKKIHSLIEKYGEFALAVFIGIPLPGSGVYSGALAAYLLGFEKKKFIVACIWGVLIAGVLVTLVSVLGLEMFQVFLKE
tara:strand:+ start:168 stop:644 length:477 start_codon:yes stop_codon:yes gene_type:complete